MIYYIIRYLLGPLAYIFMRPVVYGGENLRQNGKTIFASNHVSLGDPIVLAVCTPRPIHFMAKAELFTTKFSNALMRSCLAFPVSRGMADMSSVKLAIRILNEGKIFGIFPEGKRSITKDMDDFEKGTAFLALRTGAPVVPIYIHPDSYRTWRPKIMVGKAINVSDIVADTNKMALIEVVTDKIADAVSALKAEMEALYCK